MSKYAAAMDDHNGSFYRSGEVHSYCGDSITYGTGNVSDLSID